MRPQQGELLPSAKRNESTTSEEEDKKGKRQGNYSVPKKKKDLLLQLTIKDLASAGLKEREYRFAKEGREHAKKGNFF